MFALPTQLVQILSRHWIGSLAPYRLHQSNEHREALVIEAMRYAGLRLESVLVGSRFWNDVPLVRRAAVLLFLVDRGVVKRVLHEGRYVYEATPHAEAWVSAQPSLRPFSRPTFELLAALRAEARLRGLSSGSSA